MGYSLTIGQATVSIDLDDNYVCIEAEEVSLPEAPAYGEPTDYRNERWPSYISWGNFCRALGIEDLMFDQEYEFGCLMPEHPGCAPIKKAHLEAIQAALVAYKNKHPGHIAQYPPLLPDFKKTEDRLHSSDHYSSDPMYDGNICRAEWLVFWIDWALKNCSKPVFVNS